MAKHTDAKKEDGHMMTKAKIGGKKLGESPVLVLLPFC